MDSLSSFHVPILRGHEVGPVHNEQNPQSVGPCLRELEAQARSPAASLPLGASLRASSSGDERGQLRCRGMRRSTASASRRAVSADSRSSPTSPHPAIANRRRTGQEGVPGDRKSTRLNSSHVEISYAVFCLKKKKKKE